MRTGTIPFSIFASDDRRTKERVRDDEGIYRSARTRLAVFRHLLTAGVGEVPSREDKGLDSGLSR